ncbi:GTPase required for pre-60S ribosomal subunit nuclear export and maturation [Entomophthora muscae]|uniref:GTPase required for pre-60S ribosomal subunit nuclear export and maturation n=1 Tax=Entomophthora muscae TaxID=34485 RepID=A0ACC2TY22_9FUNG|nr:GTPase required for pre-60S ribosomal subunit nuclear export and maturation [Entomophthora muscae]
MGNGKREKNRLAKVVSKSGAGGKAGGQSLNNTKLKGENFYHDKQKVKFLNMLRGGRPTRNAKGDIIKAAQFQNTEAPVGRIAPNRKWFGNTRVIAQNKLDEFREKMGEKMNDPYQVLMRQSKLPLSLLTEPTKLSRFHMLETEKFSTTFGPKAQRKRPKLAIADVDELVSTVDNSLDNYHDEKDSALLANQVCDMADEVRDSKFSKGQSKRIWNELYKVIDSSDVILHVLDSRDPLGTRCRNIEQYLKKEAPHKHLVFILNKCDLVPTWAMAKWVQHLSQEHPTLAFHASINHCFGKGALISLLRQFSTLHKDKKQISVGMVGYPNVGKSSIINALKAKKVCTTAPIPGETKVWQYITLMKRIYMIDCPGIVHPSTEDSETDIVLKGVVRIENLKNPEDHIDQLMERVKMSYLQKTYQIASWTDSTHFLSQLASKSGKLLKVSRTTLFCLRCL